MDYFEYEENKTHNLELKLSIAFVIFTAIVAMLIV